MAQHKANKPTHAFSGLVSFLRAPVCNDLDQIDADIAVMGAPTDEGSPFMPGSRLGSRSIREHSLRFGEEGYFDHDSNGRSQKKSSKSTDIILLFFILLA